MMLQNTGVDIELTEEQEQEAVRLGTLRQENSRKDGKQHKRGYKPRSPAEALRNDIQAVGAEIAAAIAYDVEFNATVDVSGKLPDIGERIQVRWSQPHDNRLIVTHDAINYQFYVLVTGIMPDYVVRGHMLARHAKQERWVKDPNDRNSPAYFVPQEFLTPPPKAQQTEDERTAMCQALYPLIGKPRGVRVSGRLGTLKKCHAYPGGCGVVLVGEREMVRGRPQISREPARDASPQPEELGLFDELGPEERVPAKSTTKAKAGGVPIMRFFNVEDVRPA